MGLLEVGSRLHVDEGFAGGVLDHRDSVPDGFAHQLLFHVAEQDGLRADLGEDLEGA